MRVGRLAFVLPWLGLGNLVAAGTGPTPDALATVGKELFHREWVANDPRSHGGDGLGPVYNASSCVACHTLGGPGGAGGNEFNVQLVSIVGVAMKGSDRPPSAAELAAILDRKKLPKSPSFVLHHQGTDAGYEAWRRTLTCGGANEGFTVVSSQRNTPALFGSGLIDAIPDREIVAQAQRSHAEFPEVDGRVCRLEGGKIGRFGWKAQMASLDEFVRTACAVELGLDAPGHAQSADPLNPNRRAPGPDLTAGECDALSAYVASLPPPRQRTPLTGVAQEMAVAGRALFDAIGCAACHVPDVGHVHGIYSDLLLHNMGPEMSDGAASYGGGPSGPVETPSSRLLAERDGADSTFGASAQEWRTPPLWGLRDSAPYMHHGGAANISSAIAQHGGEASMTRLRFSKLSREEQAQIRSFLMSLAAPRLPGRDRARGHAFNATGAPLGSSNRLALR